MTTIPCSSIKNLLTSIPTSGNVNIQNLITAGCTSASSQGKKIGDVLCPIAINEGKVIDPDITTFSNFCTDSLNSCSSDICSPSNSPSNSLSLTCDQIKNLSTLIFADPTLMNALNKGLSTTLTADNLCSTLLSLGSNVQSIITAIVTKVPLNTEYQQILSDTIKCLCPQIKTGYIPLSPSSHPTYNYKIIGATLGGSIILFVLLGYMIDLPFFFSLLLAIIATLSLIIFNAGGIIKDKQNKPSSKWIPTAGEYVGVGSFAGITINADFTIAISNTGTVNSLACSGGICPVKDLATICGTDKSFSISQNVEDNGYPLVGDCVNKIEDTLKNADGSHIIQGLWFSRDDDGSISCRASIVYSIISKTLDIP